MPHLTIEYSANLENRADIGALCQAALKAILAAGPFETGAARVRAIRCEHYAIADELPQNAFVHMDLRIGAGRSQEEKKRAGEGIFGAASAVLAPLFETPYFALSLDIRELDPELSWKKNAFHPRFRDRQEREQ